MYWPSQSEPNDEMFFFILCLAYFLKSKLMKFLYFVALEIL